MTKAQLYAIYPISLIEPEHVRPLENSSCSDYKFSLIDADQAMRCRMKDLKIVPRDGLCFIHTIRNNNEGNNEIK